MKRRETVNIGMLMRTPAVTAAPLPDDFQPYKYGGKELDRENGLDLSDFAARQYDPATGRFTTVDPKAESYYHLSPYLYCAANPIRHIDPSGMDYHVIAYNDYVEIAADYYCYSEDFSAAQNAIEIISEQHFIYQIKHDDSIINLPIVFNLTPIIIDRDKGETFNEAINNSNGKGNVFQVTNVGMSDNQNGKTVNGNYIQIMESRIDSDTGAHEIGHTLGVIHSSGNNLMSEGSSQRTNTKFYRHSVEDIIKYPIKGKVNREKGIPSGKGLFFNNSIYDIPTLQKGKVKDVK